MIVTCASCLTKFNLDDSRIPAKGAKVRCSRCQHVFYVVPPPESKEEVAEEFESFAKYHEDLVEPGEKGKVTSPPPKVEKKKKMLDQKDFEIPSLPDVPQKGITLEGEEPISFDEEPLPPAGRRQRTAPPTWGEEERPVPAGKRKVPAARREKLPPPPVEEEEAEIRPVAPRRVARREKRSPSIIFALVVVLGIFIFGVFYLWTELGSGGRLSPYVQSPVKKATELWNRIWGTEKEGLTVGDLSGYEEKVGEIPLYVIEGKVINQSRSNKKYVKVRVVIFDKNRVKLAEKETISGRIVGRGNWKSLPADFFKGDMVIQPQTEGERVVSPEKPSPFTVVFKDLPSEAREFKVEIVESPNL